MSGHLRIGDGYVKNISESGNLKGIKDWFLNSKVTVGTRIQVEWVDSENIIFYGNGINKIKRQII